MNSSPENRLFATIEQKKMDAEALIQQIERAFEDVDYPGDDNLTDSMYGDEPTALIQAFRGKTDWHYLDAKFLDDAPGGWCSAMCFFSDAAFHFYLPAYLLADIRGQLMEQSPAFNLCSNLNPASERAKIAQVHGGGTMGSYARARADRFSDRQVAALIAYLWWKLASLPPDDPETPEITQAMDYYWLKRGKLPNEEI